MVARIAPEPINASVAVAGYRARSTALDSSVPPTAASDDAPLPPVLEPVPTPVPTPAIVPLSQAYAAALAVERMPPRPASSAEFRLRANTGWQAPDSSLRLTDRRV